MSAEIIPFSEARVRLRARRAAADAATSPIVVAAAICCLPVLLAYIIAMEATEALWRPRA